MVKKIALTFIIMILLVPFVMYAIWLGTPKQKLVIAIIDKSILNKSRADHLSLTWILNNNKYTKTSKELYDSKRDYFGFHPLNDVSYEVKGLERFSYEQLEQLSTDCKMAYYFDTYGVYNVDWYGDEKPYGVLYGGLSSQDIQFLRLMKAKNKHIVAEFDLLGGPTTIENRKDFEDEFHLRWTGWTGRFFSELDLEKNKDIPNWVKDNFEKEHQKKWDFNGTGIVLVKGNQILVLDGKDLKTAYPIIWSTQGARKKYGIPEKTAYSFWFEIIDIDTSINQADANFKLDVSDSGHKKLRELDIPNEFPAIVSNKKGNFRFKYLAGDFSNGHSPMWTSYFKGIDKLQYIFGEEHEMAHSNEFYTFFYKPLLKNILEECADGN
ncbi:hypothetical protein Murru_2894 [Allomuricauda ruestringensis DSM 13258]|uniref:Uncharacterized protein n=1 Tax=Allomuricauda ruestringensis (strain DSM 13258 / CIP 107369 / LMG 19739 / B1) TaxID=886377 RepID=G2PJG8_ALLRU|nr:hypothetical protein Murru_2894 [Allomuricauda ruestringensis DSM 13258]